MQQIGDDLAIQWEGGGEDFIPLRALRAACPCAGCRGETDILGNLYKNPDKPLGPGALVLIRLAAVGGYGVQPTWADGHTTGIYSFDYLRQIAAAAAQKPD